MSFTKTVLFITIFVCLTAISSLACDCISLTNVQSFEKADAVFIGTVIGVDNQGDKTIFTLTVDESLKGIRPRVINITSHKSNCDVTFEPGWKYVVYAQRIRERYFAGSCLSSRALEGPRGPSREYRSNAFNSRTTSNQSLGTTIVVTVLSVLTSISVGLIVSKIWNRAV